MRDLMGVYIGSMVKGKEEIFLCFDWESSSNQDEGMSHIKARYGNRKFFYTLFKTKDIDSIMLLRWKNDANGHSYEIRKPETSRSGDLIRLDLTKEFAAMGLELYEENELNQKFPRYGGGRRFYAESMWIHVGEHGYYYEKQTWSEKDYLDFCFAYPGVKIGNSLVTKIEISTFNSIRDENMEPLYDFMRTVMDEPSAVNRYTEDEVAELFTKHFPGTMHINIWCKDKLLGASIDHVGLPQRWFTKQDIVDGIRDYNSEKIETESPLELVVKELGL